MAKRKQFYTKQTIKSFIQTVKNTVGKKGEFIQEVWNTVNIREKKRKTKQKASIEECQIVLEE